MPRIQLVICVGLDSFPYIINERQESRLGRSTALWTQAPCCWWVRPLCDRRPSLHNTGKTKFDPLLLLAPCPTSNAPDDNVFCGGL